MQDLQSHMEAFSFQRESVDEQWGQVWFMGRTIGLLNHTSSENENMITFSKYLLSI